MLRSLRGRLQAWYALVLVVVIFCFAGVLYNRERAASIQHIDARLDGACRYLDATLRSFPPHELEGAASFRGPPRPPPPPPRAILEKGPGRRDGPPPPFDKGPGRREDLPPPPPPEHLYAQLDLRDSPGPWHDDLDDEPFHFTIWREDGSVLKSSDPLFDVNVPENLPPPNGSLQPDHLQRGTERIAYQMGPHRVLILVGRSMERELADLDTFFWRLAGSAIFALAIGLLGGWLIAGRVIRPISAISSMASEISANNLSRRIDMAALDSELIGLADVLNDMFGRLESAFERQRRFTADASHELRTPLSVLYSHIELALARTRTEEDYRDTLQSCFTASARMRGLVDGLLTLARADAGRLDLEFKQLDLCKLADEAVAQHAAQAQQARIHLSADVFPAPVVVSGDSLFLLRVLANLLANALRHTPAGGKVLVSVVSEKDEALMTVEDTGCGIPEEDQPRVFERFFRVDSARSRASGGSGLGLAICKSLVEAHGGTLGFTSRFGEGCCFFVRLPLATKTSQT